MEEALKERLNPWVTTPLEVTRKIISRISDVFIMIHDSRKVAAMKQQQKNFITGVTTTLSMGIQSLGVGLIQCLMNTIIVVHSPQGFSHRFLVPITVC